MTRNAPWTYEETLLAFNLYCVTPYGKMHKTNPEVIELSKLIGRSPGSIALKLGNIASHDPEVQNQGKKGMPHGAKMELVIWKEYFKNKNELIIKANDLLNQLKTSNNDIGLDKNNQFEDFDFEMVKGSTREAVINQRVGQNFFRRAVMSSYNNTCCITGLVIPSLLIASHIKPWKDSSSEEKTDPTNGLCLNALHDKAFDKGLITISKDYKIIVCTELKQKHLDEASRNYLLAYEGKSIQKPYHFCPSPDYIEYHNDMIFIG